MKRILFLLLAVSLIGTTVFAGGTRAGSTSSGSAGQVVVSTLGWGALSDDPTSYENRERAAYERDHNVKLDVQVVPYDDYPQKILTLIAANALPDIFSLEEHRVLDFGSLGHVKDLRPLYAADGQNIDDVFVAGQMANIGDKVYGVGVGGSMNLLYYNKNLFEKAGIAPPPNDVTRPWTWDQYLDALTKLTKDNRGRTPADPGFDVNNVVQWGTVTNAWWTYTLPMFYAAGTSIFAPDGMSLAITGPTGIETLQKYADLQHKYHVSAPGGTFPSSAAALINDQVAMIVNASYIAGGFVIGEGDSAIQYDVGMAQIPSQSGIGNNMVWGAAEVLSKDASPEAFAYFKYKQDSLRFIEAAEEIAKSGNFRPLFYIPLTKNIIEDPALAARFANVAHQEYSRLCAEIADKASRIGENITVRNFTQILYEYVQPAIELVITGDATAAEAFKDLDAQTRSLFQGVY
jgi:multiple sugar transport system substrate-binding protein